jgi:uncharacterized transporter YbjL
VAGEVDSLAERVKKLEEKPAKRPRKNREVAMLYLAFSVGLLVLAGLVPSVVSGAWPLAVGAGTAAFLCAFASAVFFDTRDQ